MLDCYQLRITSWQQDQAALRFIRDTVFIKEQQVPESLEWDEDDQECIHILVLDQQQPIACGRIKNNGHIGRMAVLKNYRRQGIGRLILDSLLKKAHQNNCHQIYLNAQTSACLFYQKQGFKIIGDEFLDANIPHYKMQYQFKDKFHE